MITRAVLATSLILLVATSTAMAADDENARTVNDDTLLRLTVTGTVKETPDLLSVDLDGSAAAADPATAQRQLDNKMKAATGTVGGAKGVDWQVTGYSVDQNSPDPKSNRSVWTAHQTLHLQSADSETLLGLVGRLQSAGLAVDALQWVLSPAHQVAAEQRASEQALKLLRARADAAAATLGLKVASIRSVTLGDAGRPRPMPMMRMMAAAPAAPQATRDDTDVSQEVQGVIVLRP